jgi:Zn-dependent protease with chaperone function
MVAAGMNAICNESFWGISWIGLGALVALIGAIRLQRVEGFHPRQVKSGELYKRSLVLSRLLGVRLWRISVVPFGNGRLTNAFGSWNTIAVTDGYGHWLHGAELDFVIGHELIHVKQKHALKRLVAISGEFALVAAATFVLPHPAGAWRVAFDYGAILGPMIGFYLLSQRFEYAADQGGVHLMNDISAAVRALTNMYRHAGLPARRSRFQQLFSTHPDLLRRLAAIESMQCSSTKSCSAEAEM